MCRRGALDGRILPLGSLGGVLARDRCGDHVPHPHPAARHRTDHGLRRWRADHAVAFDLVDEAAAISVGHGWDIAGLFAGCIVFFVGDRFVDRLGGGDRKDPAGAGQEGGSSLSIVLGTVLDGIPESLVIGLTIFAGGAVGAAYLAAVFISNLPESISSSSGLLAGGWTKSRVLWMWIGIAVVSGLASLAGYGLFQNASPDVVAFVLTFAAGAILTMLANTMMPEAFEHGGKLVGIMVTLGFAVAFTIHLLD
jgi:zinc transporter, ZIP family